MLQGGRRQRPDVLQRLRRRRHRPAADRDQAAAPVRPDPPGRRVAFRRGLAAALRTDIADFVDGMAEVAARRCVTLPSYLSPPRNPLERAREQAE
jgi:hypothetical protein